MPAMFPMRFSTIFKSRWWALVWAAGIVWVAYDFAASQPGAVDNSGDNSEQVNTALNSF